MIHLEEKLMGPLCKAASALALASALGLSGCSGGGAQSNAAPPALSSMVFAADDGVHGIELWKSDGTEAGTALVKDINTTATLHSFPGASGTPLPTEFAFLNGTWFFSADDGVSGIELWKSDGTERGTLRVKDININPNSSASSSPRGFTVFNNALYFSADDGGSGRELWRTDGTEGGTVQVKDIAPGSGFIGGIQVPLSSSPSGLTVFNNALYFAADDGVHGVELWKTDGTGTGTVLVTDINPTTGASSSPRGFTVFNNALYFAADDGAHGVELWKTDVAGSTVLVKDINPTADSSPSGFTVFNNALYFSADDGVHGVELWRTDGTATGTVLVTDINPTTGASSSPRGFTVFSNALYFAADDGVHGVELWKTDVAGSTVLVKDINPTADSSPSGFKVFNNALYFSASDGVAGIELWKSDGTPGGTVQVKDINSTSPGASSSPMAFTVLNNALLFSADDGVTGRELWRTDGSEAGTMRVKDICPGSCEGLPPVVPLSASVDLLLRPTRTPKPD